MILNLTIFLLYFFYIIFIYLVTSPFSVFYLLNRFFNPSYFLIYSFLFNSCIDRIIKSGVFPRTYRQNKSIFLLYTYNSNSIAILTYTNTSIKQTNTDELSLTCNLLQFGKFPVCCREVEASIYPSKSAKIVSLKTRPAGQIYSVSFWISVARQTEYAWMWVLHIFYGEIS